jgi:hypothetical protein
MRKTGMRKTTGWIVAIVWAFFSPWAFAQDPKTEIQTRLNSQFVLTRFTADHSDIVKAGSVLVLQKDNLVMFSIDTSVPPTSTYKNGKLQMGFGTSLVALRTGDTKVPQRAFVQGEKFWLAATLVQDDGVYLLVISDPFNNVRYYTKLKFPFNKKNVGSADEMMKTIAEVVSLDSGGDQNTAQQQPQPPAQPAPASTPTPAPMTAIAPPPPPADAPPAAPKTISIGQSRDMVIAILGQPQKVVKLNTKEIDIYPDLKVTFINNKVSDVQ